MRKKVIISLPIAHSVIGMINKLKKKKIKPTFGVPVMVLW